MSRISKRIFAAAGSAACLAAAIASPASAAAAKPGPTFERLAGCWRIQGVVAGQQVRHLAKGEWRLDHSYFVYQEQSAPKEPAYSAVAFFGRRDDGKLVMHWLDIYGGQYSQTTGFGEEKADRIEVDTPYPAAPMHSVITWDNAGWRMRLTEHPAGKPERLFSDYRFSPAPCDAAQFQF